MQRSPGFDNSAVLANEIRAPRNDILQLLVSLRDNAREDVVSEMVGAVKQADQRTTTDTTKAMVRWQVSRDVGASLSHPRYLVADHAPGDA